MLSLVMAVGVLASEPPEATLEQLCRMKVSHIYIHVSNYRDLGGPVEEILETYDNEAMKYGFDQQLMENFVRAVYDAKSVEHASKVIEELVESCERSPMPLD